MLPALEHCATARRTGRGALALLMIAAVGCGGAKAGMQGGMQFPPTQVTVMTVTPQTIPAQLPVSGHRPSLETRDRARAGGRRDYRAVRSSKGTDVAKGTLLYVIDTTQYAAALRTALGTLEDGRRGWPTPRSI